MGGQPDATSTEDGGTVADWIEDQVRQTRLGPKSQRVRHLLQTQPSFSAYATAAEVGQRAGVNGATVVRFAQSLGYAGWPQFQAAFRSIYALRRYDVDTEAPTTGDGGLIAATLARDAENLQACLRSVDFTEAAAIVESIRRARRTIVVGSGSHALPAQGLALMAASRGYNISVEDRGGPYLANLLGQLTEGDCIVGFSFWQDYQTTVAALRHGRRVGASTCLVTDTRHSAAAEHADYALVVPAEGLSNFRSMTAAMSLAYGLAAALAATDPAHSRSSVLHVAELWQDLDLFCVDRGQGDPSR